MLLLLMSFYKVLNHSVDLMFHTASAFWLSFWFSKAWYGVIALIRYVVHLKLYFPNCETGELFYYVHTRKTFELKDGVLFPTSVCTTLGH